MMKMSMDTRQAPPEWMLQREEVVIALEETFGVGCSFSDERGFHVFCPLDTYREPGHVAGVYFHPQRDSWVFECFDHRCRLSGKELTAEEIRGLQTARRFCEPAL